MPLDATLVKLGGSAKEAACLSASLGFGIAVADPKGAFRGVLAVGESGAFLDLRDAEGEVVFEAP